MTASRFFCRLGDGALNAAGRPLGRGSGKALGIEPVGAIKERGDLGAELIGTYPGKLRLQPVPVSITEPAEPCSLEQADVTCDEIRIA